MSEIQILTSDTVRAEDLSTYIAGDWRSIPGLQGGWSVGFGQVNQVLFLQTLCKNNEPPPLPALAGYCHPELRKRQWLRTIKPLRVDSGSAAVYELRTYDVRSGLGETFLRLMLSALPIRERYSSNYGLWESLSGRHEQVLHLWGYSDLNQRDQVRAALKRDPEWQAYIATILPMLESLQSSILHPITGS